MSSLAERIVSDGFAGYAYAYPHKTSYRVLDPVVRLDQAWQDEDKDALFLYVHLPFCEMRCGFCNLFTTIQPQEQFVADTLDAIDRQSQIVANAVQPKRIAQLAFGGGTPSYLSVGELESLFANLSSTWCGDWSAIPVSFEVSPGTVDAEKLSLLRSFGVDRISMGVQSFAESDLKQLGRPQSQPVVDDAIAMIKAAGFPVMNLDLIYGSQNQSVSSWQETVRRMIAISPEEIYLYPLYVRELTGLGKTGRSAGEHRRELFLVARDLLREAGYQAHSMRLFRRSDVDRATDHCCQDDGMIGLGPGARSYTRKLHYSCEYAVGAGGVKRIIADFNRKSADQFAVADYGVQLSRDEEQRRFVIKSLLRAEGISRRVFLDRFGTALDDDFPQLGDLIDLDLADQQGDLLRLNDLGMSWSDVIGPWLYSPAVTSRMEAFELV